MVTFDKIIATLGLPGQVVFLGLAAERTVKVLTLVHFLGNYVYIDPIVNPGIVPTNVQYPKWGNEKAVTMS